MLAATVMLKAFPPLEPGEILPANDPRSNRLVADGIAGRVNIVSGSDLRLCHHCREQGIVRQFFRKGAIDNHLKRNHLSPSAITFAEMVVASPGREIGEIISSRHDNDYADHVREGRAKVLTKQIASFTCFKCRDAGVFKRFRDLPAVNAHLWARHPNRRSV